MTDHTEQADRLEAEADALQDESRRLGEDISQAKDTWESHKNDPAVPGAVGDAIESEPGPEPESSYPTKNPTGEEDEDGAAEDDDGRRAGSPGDEDS